jgi:hypothetical protein
MMRQSRTLLTFALALVTVILLGCPQGTTIADINADPGRYRDKEVSITGRVVTSFGALGQGGYELDDGTGRIWVLTDRSVPAQGSRVRATGHVSTGITFGGRSFGTVLRETNRHSESSR